MGRTLLALAVVLAGCAGQAQDSGDGVPMFEVDPLWPKPLPNHWILGRVIGVTVDSQDHIWIIHRQNTFDEITEIGAVADPPTSECCFPAPNVLEFDQEGNLVGSWGGPGDGYDWPSSNHGITVDHMDNLWIGGNGSDDAHILKFARDGTFLMQIGRPGASRGSHDTENFGRVAKIFVDGVANEAYISDGYLNRRVAVLDASTGELKRYWGAYGDPPDASENPGSYEPGETPPQEFRTPVHCAELSNDRLLYVCDRPSNRISVFQTDGTFVKEVIIAPATLSQGSTWDIDFSHDEEQKFLYLADGQNMKVYIIDRESLEILYSVGDEMMGFTRVLTMVVVSALAATLASLWMQHRPSPD
ncbi:MAG: hypothetical protein IIA44_07555 [Acidobacteria bacterium]|nr:hypothetical protein [Acidobacteriota bacterium]